MTCPIKVGVLYIRNLSIILDIRAISDVIDPIITVIVIVLDGEINRIIVLCNVVYIILFNLDTTGISDLRIVITIAVTRVLYVK